MSTIRENFPFCYAIKDNSNIHLFILVKVPVTQGITFPTTAPSPFGQTITFGINVDVKPVTETPGHRYHYYSFPIGTIDTIAVKVFLVNEGTTLYKTMTLSVDELDVVGAGDLTLPVPDSENAAPDVPYVCTKLALNGNSFDVEVFIKLSKNLKLDVAHSGPSGSDKDTFSKIEEVAGTPASPDYSMTLKTFSFSNVNTTNGAHSATYNGRKGKTKNKHHTHFPFPMSPKKPKNGPKKPK